MSRTNLLKRIGVFVLVLGMAPFFQNCSAPPGLTIDASEEAGADDGTTPPDQQLSCADPVTGADRAAGSSHTSYSIASATTQAACDAAKVVSTCSGITGNYEPSPSSNSSCAVMVACTQTLNSGANLSSAVSGAAAGSTICLNTGTYSMSLNSVVKNPRVTVRSASGKSATVSFSMTGSTNGIILDSLTVSGNATLNGSNIKNITISNSTFINNTFMVIDGPVNSNIMLDGNTHNNISLTIGNSGVAGRVALPYGNSQHSGVTVQNSEFDGGCADGIQAGVGLNIYNNRFTNMLVGSCPNDPHTDAVQFVFHSGAGPHIKGNYFYNNEQALTAFDRVANAIIEDNILDAGPGGRPWQIEWYSDTNSIIRHNTLLYRSNCSYNMECGMIMITHKSADPAGVGTVVEDNIATEIIIDGSAVASRRKNLVRRNAGAQDVSGSPTYVGGTFPTVFSGFDLSSTSSGRAMATDGRNIGVRFPVP